MILYILKQFQENYLRIFTLFDGHLIGLFLLLGFAATCRPMLGSATKTRPPVAKQSGQCARALKLMRESHRDAKNIVFMIVFNDQT